MAKISGMCSVALGSMLAGSTPRLAMSWLKDSM